MLFRSDDFTTMRVASGRRSREQIATLGLDVATFEHLMSNAPVSIPADTIDE